MADAGPADERLPWLDAPRPATRKRPPAARRARTPLLVVLGLLLASTVAVMAFLAGRGSGPFAPAPASAPAPGRPPTVAAAVPPPAPQQVPLSTPDPALPAAPSLPPATAPAPVAPPDRITPTRASTAKAAGKRKAIARTEARRSRAVAARRNRPSAEAAPARYRWPAPSTAGPSGRVIQLGAYVNGRQTMAAWRRLRRAYPYLATLPRKVTVVSAGPGRRHYYRLRVGTPSSGHARAICDNLHRIGRGCIIV